MSRRTPHLTSPPPSLYYLFACLLMWPNKLPRIIKYPGTHPSTLGPSEYLLRYFAWDRPDWWPFLPAFNQTASLPVLKVIILIIMSALILSSVQSILRFIAPNQVIPSSLTKEIQEFDRLIRTVTFHPSDLVCPSPAIKLWQITWTYLSSACLYRCCKKSQQSRYRRQAAVGTYFFPHSHSQKYLSWFLSSKSYWC